MYIFPHYLIPINGKNDFVLHLWDAGKKSGKKDEKINHKIR